MERWPALSTAPATKPLWPLGTAMPIAGREGSHTRSVAAAQRLVASCIGATPLEGIAAAVLLRRRSDSAFGSHKGAVCALCSGCAGELFCSVVSVVYGCPCS